MQQKGFAPVLVLVLVASLAALFYFYSKDLEIKKISVVTPVPEETEFATPTQTPLKTPTPAPSQKPTATPTITPSPTPTPRPFADEETSMRKTLAGFEMFIGTSNTAGALTFFTPPVSDSAKVKYQEIRTKNLPYRLNSWRFVMDNNNILIAETFKDGYKVRVSECRTNSTTCSTLTFELARDVSAENGFKVDRYYGTDYSYQNNLGEEIKYAGFGF